jgi:hypothetical protein
MESLFELIKEQSKLKRQQSPDNFDGLSFWQPLKKMFAEYDNLLQLNWNCIIDPKTKKEILYLPEYVQVAAGTSIIKVNHFLIQQVRIPAQEKLTIRKLMQVALNIGQYQGMNNNLCSGINQYDNIFSYISVDDLKRFDLIIKKETIKSAEKYLCG